MSIGTFREWLRESELNEAEIYKVEFTDPLGNKKILSSICKIVNASGVPKSVNDLSYLVDEGDVTDETGNSGSKHYSEYLTKRIKKAAHKAKNNNSFAQELNKIFKTNIFKAI